MRRKGQENFLDYKPKRSREFLWKLDQKGHVVIARENKCFFNRAAQIFLKKPQVSYIELDDMGTFIWQQMDGTTDIYVIGEKVKEKFGKNAEPLYTRLCNYAKMLKNYKFIDFLRG